MRVEEAAAGWSLETGRKPCENISTGQLVTLAGRRGVMHMDPFLAAQKLIDLFWWLRKFIEALG